MLDQPDALLRAENNSATDTSMVPCWLSIIGIGEDGVDGLSATARQLISRARLVVGGKRHLALAAALIEGEAYPWPSPIEAAFPVILARRGEPVVVLASGDPSHYGIGNQLAALVPDNERVCLPQPSAFSLAAARLGWPLQAAACVSVHGRALTSIIRCLQPGARVLALAWDGSTAGALAELLRSRDLGSTLITVLENLGGPGERIRQQRAEQFDLADIAALNTLALELPEHGGPFGAAQFGAALVPGIADTEFESDGQLTRREIRAIVLSSLAPRPGARLWDIGLGSGSIAIEWLLCHPTMQAIGIEANASRAARAARNAARFGTPDLHIVEGLAPAALAGLPAPDAIFLGGGVSDVGVLDAAWSALDSGGRLVANAVTLEGEARLLSAFTLWGGNLTRIAIAHADPVGSMHGWRPAMPVTHYRVVKS